MTRTITGNVAVITGGGSPHGIGAATGKLLASRGVRVVLSDVNSDALETTAADLQSEGLDVEGIVADVADFDSMKNLADETFARYGRVDIAFFNAGIGGGGGYKNPHDLDSWRKCFDINVFGVLHGIKTFLPRMMEQGTVGDILGTTSGAGTIGVAHGTPAYSASKAAVVSLMESLHGFLHAHESPLRSHAVFPPLTRTNLAGDPSVMQLVEDGLKSFGVPVALAEPSEVAVTVLEAIESGNFWARHDLEADSRISEGKYAADVAWQNKMILARAQAMVDRGPLDDYLWGAPEM